MKIILPGERPVSVNKFYEQKHWSFRHKEAQRVHQLVKLSSLRFKKLSGRVDVFITAYFKNYPLDSDNTFSKLYVDGLKGRIIEDDTPKFVRWVATRSEVDKTNPRVEIEVIEI